MVQKITPAVNEQLTMSSLSLSYSSLSSVLVEILHSGVRGRIRSHITAGTRAVKCNFAYSVECFCGKKKRKKMSNLLRFHKGKNTHKKESPSTKATLCNPIRFNYRGKMTLLKQ